MTIKEMIAVMDHFDRGGKIISRSSNHMLIGDDWCYDPSPKWNWEDRIYRIKPEPKVIPWTVENAPAIVKVKYTPNEIKILYLTIEKNNVPYYVCSTELNKNYIDQAKYTMKYLAEFCKQLDGSPCGTIEKNCLDCVNCVNSKCTKPTCKNYEYFN